MPKTDKRIDAYIAKSAPFAQDIMQHLRTLVYEVCPEAEETIKWGFPHFEYNGAILCNMAAFKAHCSFGFWKASLMTDPGGLLETVGKTAMGHFGKITNINELPADKTIKAYIKQAVKLNKDEIKVAKAKPAAKEELVVPAYFKTAIVKNKAALKTFNEFSTSNKREYVEWVTEAKTEATKQKRMEQAIEWMAEGKIRHWKYAR